jgi:hypothetical protein
LNGLACGQLTQQVNIPRDQVIFGDDDHRISEFREHGRTGPRQLQPPFHRLVAIRDAAHRQRLRFPLWRGKLAPQQPRRLRFDHDPALEIQPGGKAEIFAGDSRIAITAPVFTPAIGVDSGPERYIRAVVVGNDALGPIPVKPGLGGRVLCRIPIGIAFQRKGFKPVGRVAVCTPPARHGWRAGHGQSAARSIMFQNASIFIACK